MTEELKDQPVYIDTDGLSRRIRLKKNTIEVKRSKGDDLPPCYYVGRRVLYKLSEVDAWIESKRHVPSSVQLAQSGKGV